MNGGISLTRNKVIAFLQPWCSCVLMNVLELFMKLLGRDSFKMLMSRYSTGMVNHQTLHGHCSQRRELGEKMTAF